MLTIENDEPKIVPAEACPAGAAVVLRAMIPASAAPNGTARTAPPIVSGASWPQGATSTPRRETLPRVRIASAEDCSVATVAVSGASQIAKRLCASAWLRSAVWDGSSVWPGIETWPGPRPSLNESSAAWRWVAVMFERSSAPPEKVTAAAAGGSVVPVVVQSKFGRVLPQAGKPEASATQGDWATIAPVPSLIVICPFGGTLVSCA